MHTTQKFLPDSRVHSQQKAKRKRTEKKATSENKGIANCQEINSNSIVGAKKFQKPADACTYYCENEIQSSYLWTHERAAANPVGKVDAFRQGRLPQGCDATETLFIFMYLRHGALIYAGSGALLNQYPQPRVSHCQRNELPTN